MRCERLVLDRYGRLDGFMNQAYLGMSGGPGYGPPPRPVVVYPGYYWDPAGVGMAALVKRELFGGT